MGSRDTYKVMKVLETIGLLEITLVQIDLIFEYIKLLSFLAYFVKTN